MPDIPAARPTPTLPQLLVAFAMIAIFGFGGVLTFAGVPEPSTWATSILGMGVIGAALRRRTRAAAS